MDRPVTDGGNGINTTTKLQVDEASRKGGCGVKDGPSKGGRDKRKREVREVDDDAWKLTRPAPGGPEDISLLTGYCGHVAYFIWNNEERDLLVCHTRGSSLQNWRPLPEEPWFSLVTNTQLGHLSHCMFAHLNMPLISAFVERWHPETNCFHLPFGEMSIALHDVAYILGIKIDGDGLHHNQMSKKQMLTSLSCNTSNEDRARDYILNLLGGSILMDMSSDKLNRHIRPWLEDLSFASKYAWGTATLAYLYRQLGMASRKGCSQIGGCLTLLEAWIYEYFPIFAPHPNTNFSGSMPRVSKWLPERAPPKDFRTLQQFRIRIDRMTADEVIWTPFTRHPHKEHEVTLYEGLIQLLDVVEPYMPDRFLRQFGIAQGIPSPPIPPEEVYRPADGDYISNYPPNVAAFYWGQRAKKCSFISTLRATQLSPSEVTSEYLQWFKRHSHVIVQNPDFYHGPVPEASSSSSVIQMDCNDPCGRTCRVTGQSINAPTRKLRPKEHARRKVALSISNDNVGPSQTTEDMEGPMPLLSTPQPISSTPDTMFTQMDEADAMDLGYEENDSPPPTRTTSSCGRRGNARSAFQSSGMEEWLTTDPMPGGPANPEILMGYRGHVANAIWANSAHHKPLTIQTRDRAQQRWALTEYDPELTWVRLVRGSGLSELAPMMFQRPNAALITAFVERWHPETNSFHMPFGEMTITLHDVSEILGLPITGMPVQSFELFEDDKLREVVMFKSRNKNAVVLSSLKDVCVTEGISQNSIARSFLWYLLGSTIFPDKSGSYVSYQYIHLLGDLEEIVPNYVWGAATLAYLYYQLGVASRKDAKQITGCLTLLECWIYEYFPIFTRVRSPRWVEGRPRAMRWGDNNTRMRDEENLILYRQQLDLLKADEIMWTPYGPPTTIPAVSLYHGCIRFMGYNEAYMPDRVARQFGRVQGIPRPIIQMADGTKLAPTARSYKKVYGCTDVNWENLRQHSFAPGDLGSPALIAQQTSQEYMDWFSSRSHVRVHNPAHGVAQISTITMYSASQQRLQLFRQRAFSLSQEVAQISDIPTHIREGIDDIRRLAGTGGLPG